MSARRVAYALTALALFATPALAQSHVCAPTAGALVDQLRAEYGEALTAAGVDSGGNLVQVYSSPGGSWTIAVTVPGGPTCIVSSGEGFAVERPEPAKPQGRVS